MAIVNGDFAQGLIGWTVTGEVAVAEGYAYINYDTVNGIVKFSTGSLEQTFIIDKCAINFYWSTGYFTGDWVTPTGPVDAGYELYVDNVLIKSRKLQQESDYYTELVENIDVSNYIGSSARIVFYSNDTGAVLVFWSVANITDPYLLSVISYPSGASIFLDGTNTGQVTIENTPVTINVPSGGLHTITLELAGYTNYEETINIPICQIVNISAIFEGCIYFNIIPSGASIYIDNIEQIGITPNLICNVSLNIPHLYEITLPEYYAKTGTIILTPGKGQKLDIVLDHWIGYINFDSSPQGATIILDGVDQGITPKNIQVFPGIHTYFLVLTGYIPYSRSINVGKDETISVYIAFEEISPNIVNGTFDTDLNGWIYTTSGNADVILDNGRARLRVYQCSNATLEQTFIIGGYIISFDWDTVADKWNESIWYVLKVDGVEVKNVGFAVGIYGSHRYGHETIDVSAYLGRTATLSFYLAGSGWCDAGDHANTYLWIDNVIMFKCPTPVVSITCPTPSVIRGTAGDIIVTTAGTPNYTYKLYVDSGPTPVDTFGPTGATSHTFVHMFSETIGSHTYKVEVTDSCLTGANVVSNTCSTTIQAAIPLVNGTFDTDLNGWLPTGISGNADVIWDSGRARLRVYKCSSATLEQTFIINGIILSFNWDTVADKWNESIWYVLKVDGVEVKTGGFAVGIYGSHRYGCETIDVSAYLGRTATLSFYLAGSGYCGAGDHANTYLWIDNVEFEPIPPPGTWLTTISDVLRQEDPSEINAHGNYANLVRTLTLNPPVSGSFRVRINAQSRYWGEGAYIWLAKSGVPVVPTQAWYPGQGWATYTFDVCGQSFITEPLEVWMQPFSPSWPGVYTNDLRIYYDGYPWYPSLQLYATASAVPSQINSGDTSQITIHITDDSGVPVGGANINLSTTNGILDPIIGTTDINGDFTSTYTAPIVTDIQTFTATAITSKSGYVDGSGSTQIIVRTPANIVATAITPSVTTCTAPCNMTVDITWTNNGGTSGTFIPTITVNGTPTTLPEESLGPSLSVTKTFSLTGLIAGTYNICSEPNTFPCATVTVLTPANVISATLTVDTNDCVAPCTVNGTVSWTNTGGSPGTLDLAILVNTVPTSLGTSVTIGPGQTITYEFSLPGLTAGTYQICASPDSGTTCQTITIRTPANIVATAITPSVTTCTEPCSLTVNVTWANTGGVVGIFTPAIVVDGTSIPLATPETLDPTQSVTKTFTVANLMKGSHTICASPDTGAACVTITVEQVVQAGFGGAGMILLGGLLIGMLISKKCEDYKTKEECQANECQWKKNKCVPFGKEDQYLIAKLREKGAVGTPICKGEECKIGKWVAIYRKGKEPIIIHDPQ